MAGGAAQTSADGRTAYAVVTFDEQADDITEARRPGSRRDRKGPRPAALQVELGGSAVALSREHRPCISAEAIGVVVAALVLLPRLRLPRRELLPIATALVSIGTASTAIELLGHVMTVADFAPMLGDAGRARRRYRLRAVHRDQTPQGAARGHARRGGGARRSTRRAGPYVFAGGTVCIALLGMLILRLASSTASPSPPPSPSS